MEFTSIIIIRLFLLLLLVVGNGCYGCWEQDRIALLQLKASIVKPDGFDSWENEEGTTDCCEWARVECDNTTRRVTKLSLSWISTDWPYDSYLNASVFLPFEALTILDLSYNRLPGCVENEGFEKLSRLSNLHSLDLSYNSFDNSILSSLNQLSTLKTLNLGYNNLNGTFNFQELDGLDSLKELHLNQNNLDSIISNQAGLDQIPRLENLEVLDMSYNRFDNKIWLSLAELPSLKTLYLRGNQLNRTIPNQDLQKFKNIENLFLDDATLTSLDQTPRLKNLELFDMSSNIFDNKTWLFMSELPSLKTLDLSGNKLTMLIPNQGLCELRSLQELDLMDNRLEGPLPGCLANLTSLRILDLSSNLFTGNIDMSSPLVHLISLRYLDLSWNLFTGNIDMSSPLVHLISLEYLSLSSNSFRIPISFRPLFNHSKLKFIESLDNELLAAESNFDSVTPSFQLIGIRLSDHAFGNIGNSTGAFPNFLYYHKDLQRVGLSRITFHDGKFPSWLLENNTELISLRLPNNSLTGLLELSFFPKTRIIDLDVSKNHFYDNIPENIGMVFPHLNYLNMSGNGFGGSIPYSLGDLSSLLYLDLSHNKLSQGIPPHLAMGCVSLEVLILSYNKLQGPILPERNNLTMLYLLYLDNNHFTKISSSLSNSSSLLVLNISQNHLSGKLPRWMGGMIYLSFLDLSNNHLGGSIPMEFCHLENLYFINLSDNNVTGTIPFCFNSLIWMTYFDMSKNSLEGPLLPAFFNSSSSLVGIDLSHNHLTGHIPSWIGTLSSLSILLLKNNHIEGEIPISLCHMSQLSLIDLSYNNLSGHIPPCLSNIPFAGVPNRTQMVLLSFGTNFGIMLILQDMGIMSQSKRRRSWDSYSVQPQVQVTYTTKGMPRSYKGINLDLFSAIDLSCNKLNGHIPQELGNIGQLRELNLSCNGLSGTIPTTLSNLNSIESLDLSFNNLSGKIPSQLAQLHFLAVLNMLYNNLSGSIPQGQSSVQFDTFDNSSYLGNPLLCGPPLSTTCTAQEPPRATVNSKEVDFGSTDMEYFYLSFTVSYITVLLVIATFLYMDPYWRRAWFHLVEVCITSCHYFVMDNFRRVFFS